MIELKELMLHVEQIVRPVRAMELRKLQMRRELLGHLQAAFIEEQEGGADESAAWEAAKKRLGEPEALTKELQRAVPWLEGYLAPRPQMQMLWMKGMRGRISLGLLGMRWPWQFVFMAAISFCTWGWIFLEMTIWTHHGRRSVETLFGEHPWHLPAAVLVASLTCVAMFVAGIWVLDAMAVRAPWIRVVRRGLVIAGIGMAAQVVLCPLLLRSWGFIGLGLVEGVVITAVLAWLGRFLRPGVRDLTAWFEIKVAA